MDTESQSTKKEWIHPTKANLYHKDKLIGVITDISVEDMYQWSGRIELTAEAQAFKEMFAHYGVEDFREPEQPDDSELPFDEALLDDWFIEDENGRREISFPAVMPDGEVFWRD